jgi:hypothetical protein
VRRKSKLNIQTARALNRLLDDPLQPTFTPRINPISDNLDNRMRILRSTTTDSGNRRCDTLYELAIHKKHQLEVKRMNRIED